MHLLQLNSPFPHSAGWVRPAWGAQPSPGKPRRTKTAWFSLKKSMGTRGAAVRGRGRPSCPGSLLWGLQRLRMGKFGHCGDGQGQGHIPVSESGASNAPRGGSILAGAGDGDGESPNPYFWPLFWTLKATRSAPAGRRSGGDSTRSSKIHRSWSNPPRWDKGRGGFPIPGRPAQPGARCPKVTGRPQPPPRFTPLSKTPGQGGRGWKSLGKIGSRRLSAPGARVWGIATALWGGGG